MENEQYYIYGKLNQSEILKEYESKETDTAKTEVDNTNNTIAVNVKAVPGILHIFDTNYPLDTIDYDGSINKELDLSKYVDEIKLTDMKNYLLSQDFARAELKSESDKKNVLHFYRASGEEITSVELSGFTQIQSDLSEINPANEAFVKNKSTKYLINDGEDGTSGYATQKWTQDEISKHSIDLDVIKDISLSQNETPDYLAIKKDSVNLNTRLEKSEDVTLPLATNSKSGLMSSTDVNAISDLKGRVENLEGKTTRLLYSENENPTVEQINTFVENAGYTSPFEGIAVVVDKTFHIWHYYENIGWQDDGQDTVSTFTNNIAGIIKGSEIEGRIYAENDGTGSLVGYDNLKNKLNTIQEGAEVNTIDSISLNGNALTPDSNKNVNILESIPVITGTQEKPINFATDLEFDKYYLITGYVYKNSTTNVQLTSKFLVQKHESTSYYMVMMYGGNFQNDTITSTASLCNSKIYLRKDNTGEWSYNIGGNKALGISKFNGYNSILIGSESILSLYAPTEAGTKGQILKSNGSNNTPTWVDMPEQSIKTIVGTTDKPINLATDLEVGKYYLLTGYVRWSDSYNIHLTTTVLGANEAFVLVNKDSNNDCLFVNYSIAGQHQASVISGLNTRMHILSSGNIDYTNIFGGVFRFNGHVPVGREKIEFYAPITSGTANQILQSNGASKAPTWIDNPVPRTISNTIVSNWIADTTYPDFGYKADISITNLTENDTCEVIFNQTDASSGNYAQVNSSSAGTLNIYSKVNTEITIPTIIVIKGGY